MLFLLNTCALSLSHTKNPKTHARVQNTELQLLVLHPFRVKTILGPETTNRKTLHCLQCVP